MSTEHPNRTKPHQRRLGHRGELAALAALILKGYRLRDRNWKGSGGELDLVVERGGTVVFVEVKTRGSDLFGGALSAVDGHQERRIADTAAAYLSRHGLWDRPCRFDVVAIERRGGFFPWRIRHLRDAFQPNLGRLM
jgi:putative endonuclease